MQYGEFFKLVKSMTRYSDNFWIFGPNNPAVVLLIQPFFGNLL